MAYKILISICAIGFLLLNISCDAQVDSVVVLSRNGIDTKFTYRKYKTRGEMQEVKFPHFGITRNNIGRVSALLTEFTQMETRYTALIKVNHDLDSIHNAREKKLEETVDLEKKRADNFEQANKNLVVQYNALDNTLKDSQKLALTTRKQSWWRGAKQVGILALAAGVVVGILIAK